VRFEGLSRSFNAPDVRQVEMSSIVTIGYEYEYAEEGYLSRKRREREGDAGTRQR